MAIRILSDQNVTSNVIAIQAFRLGTDSLWKLRGNAASTELAFEYSTSATLNDNNIKVVFKPSGDVGIGTNSPAKKLDVEGNIRTINTAGTVAAEIDVTSGSTWRLRSNPTSGTNNYGLDIIKGGAGTDVKMSIDSSGNVGIGTIEPDGKVHIFKGSNGATTVGTASDELILENDTDCGLTIRSAADATGVVSFASPTDHNVGQLYYNHDDDSMVIRTNDAIRTIIGSSGIMYIMGATASTNNSLQLQYNSTAGTAEIYSKSTGGNTTFEFYTSNSGTTTQKFNIGSSGDIRITNNGKFLQGVRNTSGSVIDMIGFGAGTDRLQIKGGTSGGAESIAFFDTAGQMATFYNSNFGIGVTSPSQKLEVTGNFKLNGTVVQEGTGNNLTFKYRTANSNSYTGGNATCKFGRFYWTPAHWVTGAPVIKVTLQCKYYQGEQREYIIKAGYQDTDPIINELQPSSTLQRITLVVGATTSAGYNYAGQPVYYVDLQWVQTSYIWGWAQIESQVGFLTSNPTSGWGGVVMDSGITQTNGSGLVTNNTSFFAGSLGVGTALPTSQLHVNNTVDGDKIRWSKSDVLVGSVGTYNGVPYIGYQGGAGGGIMFNGASIEPTALGSTRSSNTNDIGSATYKWRNLYVGDGVFLGGTSTSNKLTKFHGNQAGNGAQWTPTVTTSQGTSPTITASSGYYQQVGNVVTVSFEFTMGSNHASGGGIVIINNLPIAIADSLSVSGCGLVKDLGKTINVFHYTATNQIGMYFYDGNYCGTQFRTVGHLIYWAAS